MKLLIHKLLSLIIKTRIRGLDAFTRRGDRGRRRRWPRARPGHATRRRALAAVAPLARLRVVRSPPVPRPRDRPAPDLVGRAPQAAGGSVRRRKGLAGSGAQREGQHFASGLLETGYFCLLHPSTVDEANSPMPSILCYIIGVSLTKLP